MNNPLLSIIIPIYNVENYLSRCLDSVINQTYRELEIICVDDGSTDKSGIIADEFALQDNRIKVIHKKNEGLVSARKHGLKLARGVYSAYVDSDDWINPDMYMKLVSLALRYDADIVTSGCYRDYGSYLTIEDEKMEKGVYKNEGLEQLKQNLVDKNKFFLANISVHIWNKLFRTDKLYEHQMNVDNKISIGEDIAVSYPAIWDSNCVVVSGESFYHYCLRQNSMMGTHTKNDSFAVNVFSKYMDAYVNNNVISYCLDIQIKILKLYVSAFKNTHQILRYEDGILYPFGKVSSDESLAIYGAGKFGKEIYFYLKETRWFKDIIWVDSDGKNGANCISDVNILMYDKIIIAALVADVFDEIERKLLDIGVTRKQILRVELDLWRQNYV